MQKKLKIALVAPARAVSNAIIQKFEAYCKAQNFDFELGNFLLLPENPNSIWSADTQERAKEFQKFIDNSDIDAIFCARGGYGSTHLLPYLDFSPLQTKHKWIVGFSDITILHLALQKQNICSLHASMPAHWATQSKESLDSLTNILLKNEKPTEITSEIQFENINNPYNKNQSQQLTGKIIGGNLTMCVHSLGTPYELDTTDKILILEDVGEYVYHIDRLLMQLYHAGKFENLKGLIVGDFSQIKDNELHFGKSIEELFCQITQKYNYPILFGAKIGHGYHNHAFVMGGEIMVNGK